MMALTGFTPQISNAWHNAERDRSEATKRLPEWPLSIEHAPSGCRHPTTVFSAATKDPGRCSN